MHCVALDGSGLFGLATNLQTVIHLDLRGKDPDPGALGNNLTKEMMHALVSLRNDSNPAPHACFSCLRWAIVTLVPRIKARGHSVPWSAMD